MSRAKPMTKVALKALRGSIEKWEKIVAGTGEDRGTDNCPLCAAFRLRYDNRWRVCAGCPVRSRVGMPGCRGTPYDAWMRETDFEPHGFVRVARSSAAAAAAQAELDFLRSLLPPAEEA